MTEPVVRKISEAHAASLVRAGIPKRYHERSLLNMGAKGATATTWIKANASAVKEDGVGATIIDDEVFLMTARGLHLMGVGVRILTPTMLRAGIALEVDDMDVPSWFGSALFIRFFHKPGVRTPWTSGWEQQVVEEFLTDHNENNGAIFLRFDGNLLDVPPDWWSGDFLKPVSKTSPRMGV